MTGFINWEEEELRDRFAMAVVTGLAPVDHYSSAELAAIAYNIADAMMHERGNRLAKRSKES